MTASMHGVRGYYAERAKAIYAPHKHYLGSGWIVHVYDSTVDAWREYGPMPYWHAVDQLRELPGRAR